MTTDSGFLTDAQAIWYPEIPTRIHDRVAIVGFADGHRDQAPWQQDGIEFWGINRLHAVLAGKPWHRWFELHSLNDFYRDDREHQIFLQTAGFPVYIRRQDQATADLWRLPTATPYPLETVLAAFPNRYFNNTISYLLALAILMGFEEIQLYGVDMAQDTVLQQEYAQQRPSAEWLIGFAQGKGIDVVIPPGSDLLKTSHLYGFESDEYNAKLINRLNELGQRKEQMRNQMAAANQQAQWYQARLSEIDGAMQDCQYNLRNLVTPAAIPEGNNEQSQNHPNNVNVDGYPDGS